MTYLCIDTSTNALIIILNKDGQELEVNVRYGKSDHQAHIIPMIEAVLQKHNLTPKQLDGVVVGIGPGSYTGLRVGVMTAKMLSYAAGIKLYKISSLVFLTSGYEKEVLAWHDARNNQGFSAHILNGQLLSEEKIRHLDDLTAMDREKLLLLTNDTILINSEVILKQKEEVLDIYQLIPNYLRQTEAEKNLDQKRKHS